MNILLVEDEPKIAGFVVAGFREQGFAVEHCADGLDGYARASSGHFDAIVLDIMLPGRDGLSILQGLRRAGVATPVILLTARNEPKSGSYPAAVSRAEGSHGGSGRVILATT